MPTDRKTLSYLRLADEKVRKCAYVEALQAVRLAQAADPGNLYAQAYAERIQDLLNQQPTEPQPPNLTDTSKPVGKPARSDPREILAILDSVNELIARADYETALQKIRRARHLDPFDNDVHMLEERIRNAFERQLEQEFSQSERESVREFLSSLIETACVCASRGEFDAAFKNITQGALLNPEDEGLKECATLVTVARNQWNAYVEEQRTASACLVNVLEACRKRDAIRHRAYTARTHILDGEYDDALLEIALALTIEPTHPELRSLEQEAWHAKARAAARDEAVRLGDGTVRLTRLYLLAADEFARSSDYAEALELIGKMRALDPLNPDARKAELRIRQLEVRRQQKPVEKVQVVTPHEQVANEQ